MPIDVLLTGVGWFVYWHRRPFSFGGGCHGPAVLDYEGDLFVSAVPPVSPPWCCLLFRPLEYYWTALIAAPLKAACGDMHARSLLPLLSRHSALCLLLFALPCARLLSPPSVLLLGSRLAVWTSEFVHLINLHVPTPHAPQHLHTH